MEETKELLFEPSTIETIDTAVYNWINSYYDIYTNTQDGWKKVPVIWLSAERAYQMKSDKDLRDSSGMLRLPLITIDRTEIKKDLKNSAVPANIPALRDFKGGSVELSRTINQVKTSNFQSADLKRGIEGTVANRVDRYGNFSNPFGLKDPRATPTKVVYTTVTTNMPIPVFVKYTLLTKCDFLQQANEVIQTFITKNGNKKTSQINEKEHTFEVFFDENFGIESNSQNLGEERKIYTSKITFNVLGYLSGQGGNQNTPTFVKRENAVEIKIPRERVMVGDINQIVNLSKNKTNYRE
jgi:hypothetical protein